MAAVRPVGAATFGDPVRLSFGGGLVGEPKITAAGAATLVLWAQNTRRCRQQVFAAVRPAEGAFSRAIALSGTYRPQQAECRFGSGQLALAGSARFAIAAWVQDWRLHVTTLVRGRHWAIVCAGRCSCPCTLVARGAVPTPTLAERYHEWRS